MKKALLVGLNRYPDPANHLNGCVNDVLQTSAVLQQAYGFDDAKQIRLLVDERARTQAIVDRLEWLVAGSGPGDILLFHYSGHGSQVRDREGDELSDGLDEIICPYDLDWDRPFTDDDLYDIVSRAGTGANLTVILDCCHSGTGLRAFPTAMPSRSRCLPPPPDVAHRVLPHIVDCGEDRRLTMTVPRHELALRRFGARAAGRGAILLAACRDDQTSADAWIDGDYHGAFTYFLWRTAAEAGFTTSPAELVRRTRRALARAGYDQVPQVEGPVELTAQPMLAPFALEGR